MNFIYRLSEVQLKKSYAVSLKCFITWIIKQSPVFHAHITNLRHSPIYNSHWVNGTKPRIVPIGITMPSENFGRPGSIVDVVHQRDVYHINSVDEITQWEVVVCIPQISEVCMIPALLEMFKQYPFAIFNFHSDRGGENINYQVAYLWKKERIKQTKSRSRHCNDNVQYKMSPKAGTVSNTT